MPSQPNNRVDATILDSIDSINRYLELANERMLSRLLLMPIARGNYQSIADEIERWDKEYPQEVLFYHLQANDYRTLRAR